MHSFPKVHKLILSVWALVLIWIRYRNNSACRATLIFLQAEEIISTLEKAGDPRAIVARAHQARDGVPPNFKEAFRLYRNSFIAKYIMTSDRYEKAANAGEAEGMYNLGLLYKRGFFGFK